MSLVRFDMSQEIDDLRREINRMFGSMPLLPTPTVSTAVYRWLPAMDTVEQDGELKVIMDLPGLSQKDIDIKVDDDMLTISGRREIERERRGQQWYRYERSSGEFERSLQLPEGFNADDISASFDKGELTVTIPVPERRVTGTRHIEVTGGAA